MYYTNLGLIKIMKFIYLFCFGTFQILIAEIRKTIRWIFGVFEDTTIFLRFPDLQSDAEKPEEAKLAIKGTKWVIKWAPPISHLLQYHKETCEMGCTPPECRSLSWCLWWCYTTISSGVSLLGWVTKKTALMQSICCCTFQVCMQLTLFT